MGIHKMGNIFIQFQEHGTWRTCVIFLDTENAQRILIEMQIAQRNYPGKRIRAVDNDNRLIDMLA